MREMKGIIMPFICFLLMLPLAFAGMGSDGTKYNVTEYIGIMGDTGVAGPYIVRVTGSTTHPFDLGIGGVYKARLGFLGATVDTTQPRITSQIIKLNHMKNGTENFTIRYNVSDPGGGFNSDACWAINNGTKYAGTLEAGNTCEINISVPQMKHVIIYPKVNDSAGNIGTGVIFGVNVSFDSFQRDKSKINNLSIQNFLELINFSSSGAWENISWSKNSSEPYTTLNVTLADFQDNSTTHHLDFISQDTYYTIAGTVFHSERPYQLVRYFEFNNSLAYELPSINLSLMTKRYSANALVENKTGIAWPDQVTGSNVTHMYFNTSPIGAGAGTDYRYSYTATLINISGRRSATWTYSGSYKKWQLRQNLTVNYNLTGKTVNHTIDVGRLGEWIGKTASWTTTVTKQSSSEAVTHTATDRIDNLTINFDPPEDVYELVVTYFTYVGGGGGGGAGSPPTVIQITQANATNGTIKFGTNLISCLVPYTGFRCYKETTIQAESGMVTGRIEVGEKLLNYGFTAEICDIGTEHCGNSFTLLKGEKKLLRFDGIITEEAAEDLMEQPSLLSTIQATQEEAANAIDVEIDRAPLFTTTKKIADSRGWAHKPVAIMTYVLVLIIVGWIGFEILRNTLS